MLGEKQPSRQWSSRRTISTAYAKGASPCDLSNEYLMKFRLIDHRAKQLFDLGSKKEPALKILHGRL
jgi:hypothetical protein